MRIDDLTALVDKLKAELRRSNSSKQLAEQQLEKAQNELLEMAQNRGILSKQGLEEVEKEFVTFKGLSQNYWNS